MRARFPLSHERALAVRTLKRAALVAAVALTLCAAANAAVIKLDAHANGKVVRVHVGDRIVLRLKANASTGFAWRLVSRGVPVLRLDSTRYVPGSKAVLGSPGSYVARFTVRASGRAKVSLVYKRHTQPPTPPAARFALAVISTKN